ncbi:MAG: sensor histidine kinase, partial [Bacteroidota bacterium]
MDALATALDGRAGETLVALRGHHFDLWFRPVFDRDDELTRIIGVAANVSELVATQAELEDSRGALRELAAHLQHIREEERSALSREVHDRLGQMLTSLRLDVSWVARHLDRADTEGLQARLARVNTQIDETIQHVRHIAQALRPSILDDIGLASALEWHAQQFADRAGVACTVTASLDTDEADIPEAAATALFRIAQEALTNVARHADATEVGLHLEEADGDLVLHVIDDGRGFSLAADAPVRSLGLLGMRERASILGGTVAFEGEPGVGTHVRAAVPLR